MVIQLVSEKDAYCTVMGTPSKSLGMSSWIVY
jgi:hypothetical protein